MDTYAVIQAGTEAKYYADGSQVYCKVNYVASVVNQAGTEAKYYADGSQVYCNVNYVVHTGTRTHVASVVIQAGTEA